MRTDIPEKIHKILDDLDVKKNLPRTRLTVLKKWFERPGRLSAFGLWVARRAAARKGKTKGAAGVLLAEAGALLGPASTRESVFQQIDRKDAQSLLDRARDFQNQFENQQGIPVRIINCWPLLLVEEGLAVHLASHHDPGAGYRLAADWTENYDPRYGSGLNGPSVGKLQELVRFMFVVEGLEDT